MSRTPSRASVAAVVLAVALTLATNPASAASNCESPPALTALSCASTSLCVATQTDSHAVWVTNPLTERPWISNVIDWDGMLQAISCPSVSFCAATDSRGNVATSTYPRNTQVPWKLAHIDRGGPTTLVYDHSPIGLEDISCPSASFCLAVDEEGDVLASRDPAGGASKWYSTDVDGTNLIGWVACASSSLCVALDYEGNLVASKHPDAGAAAWAKGKIDAADGGGFSGLTCPSTTLCVAVDAKWNVLTSSNPADPRAWSITGHITPSRIVTIGPSNGRLSPLGSIEGVSRSVYNPTENVLSCPSPSLCVITSYFSAQMFTSTDPGSSSSTWVPAGLQHPADGVYDVSCPTITLCVGSTYSGSGVTSTQPAVSTTVWNTTIAPAHVTSCTRPEAQLSGISMIGMAQGAPSITFTVSSARGTLPLTGAFLDPFDYDTNTPDGLSASSQSVLSTGVTVLSAGRTLKVNASTSPTVSTGVRVLNIDWQPPESTVTVRISSPVIGVFDHNLVLAARSHRRETLSAMLIATDQDGSPSGGGAPTFVNLLLPVR